MTELLGQLFSKPMGGTLKPSPWMAEEESRQDTHGLFPVGLPQRQGVRHSASESPRLEKSYKGRNHTNDSEKYSNFIRRIQKSIEVGGRNFEHVLKDTS